MPAVSEWERLRSAAVHHGIAALLFARIAEADPSAVPPEQLEALRALAVANERRSLRMSVQLLRVLRLLGREGFEAFPVKGPVMAQALYGDLGLRNSVDLDIAVRASDVAVVRDVLFGEGFQQITGVGIAVDRLLASECEVTFEDPGQELVLDLHWRLGPRFAHASLSAEELMSRACRASFLGHDVLTLSREDLFILMCVHGAHNHRWDQLELVAALGAWGATASVAEWLTVLRRAARLGCLRRCIIGCLLMRDVAGCRLPVEVSDRVARDRLAARLARVARESLFAGGLDPSDREGIGGVVWESLALDRPAVMVGHFVARALTPGTRDWQSGWVPRGLSGLYYFFRPLRLASRHLGRGGSG